MSEEFILEYMVPNIRKIMMDEFSSILGTALLLFVFVYDTNNPHLSSSVLNHVQNTM